MNKFLKVIFTTLGIIIFIYCITGEIDGVGRFPCILFGTIFSIIGSCIKTNN